MREGRWGDDGRLASVGEDASVIFEYDGRPLLLEVEKVHKGEVLGSVRATYSSEGVLHALLDKTETWRYVVYLSGRSIALLETGATPTWTFLSTDHLGTPVLAMNAAGATIWSGGFEPFGHDWQFGASSATENGVFLRLPGQWADPLWEEATLGIELFHNVYRWYESGTGRYASTDPLTLGLLVTREAKDTYGAWGARGLATARVSRPELDARYAYASGSPVIFADPDGRASMLTPWLWLAWWTEVLVCEQDVEICKLWCYTNQCDRCRPAPRGPNADYRRIFTEDDCRSSCSSYCEYETNCWWKTIRRPLMRLGGRLLRSGR